MPRVSAALTIDPLAPRSLTPALSAAIFRGAASIRWVDPERSCSRWRSQDSIGRRS